MPGKGNPSKLIPMKKGDPTRNPAGRAGKSGTGGLSLLASYRKFINEAPPGMVQGIWMGLVSRAQAGDTKAVELIVRLNQEAIVPTMEQADAANRGITITIVDPGAVVNE